LEASVLVLQMGEIYEARRWDGLRWHDIHTKFHDDLFRNSSNIKGITLILEAVVSVLLIERINELRSSDGFIWYDIYTKFHEECYRH
jgi:hypothetical protein